MDTLSSLRVALAFGLLLLPTMVGRADDQLSEIQWFEKHIRPTLVEHCIRCHGPKKQQAGLRLDHAAGLRSGGDTGPAVVPGDPDSSLLMQAIRYDNVSLEMPPRGKLPASTIAAFEKWIRLGAVDPRQDPRENAEPDDSTSGPPSVEEGRSFWAFQPIDAPVVPPSDDHRWALGKIDCLILARMQSEGCQPTVDADRETFIRRVSYDLTGLPPTPAEIRDFVDDESAQAYETLVDRLLGSYAFAERWGRHWLDVVRYAESSGGGRTLLFPDAWRYRDFVIDSFDRDLPYDQFLRLQLAGDLIPESDWQQRQRNLVATGFLLLGPTNFELQDKDVLEMDVIDEQLDTIGKSMLGMTIGCARCHDHKFDPIPTADYYAMAGIFKSTLSMTHSNVSTWNTAELPLSAEEESRYAKIQSEIKTCKGQIQDLNDAIERAGGKSGEIAAKDASVDPDSLPGIVIDNAQALRTGQWMESKSNPKYVGANYIHDETSEKGAKHVVYETLVPESGRYEVRVSHSSGSNRSTRVPIRIRHAEGEALVRVNQRKQPPIDHLFNSVGTFSFDSDQKAQITVSNEGTEDGVVIADCVVLIPAETQISTTAKETSAEDEAAAAEKKKLLAALHAYLERLNQRLRQLQSQAAERPVAMATRDQPTAADIPIALRGVVANQGPVVPRGALSVVSSQAFPRLDERSSGRLEFADWITSRQNPLTARVMANRVWYWMMGRGLVETVDNFGATGQRPSHPKLLDHLAESLMADDWSIKKLVRKIALSRTYRLSSTSRNDSLAMDPENRWFWRMTPKQMRAEAIRDTLLFISGDLDRTRGGRTIKPGTSIEYGYRFDSNRRSVYLPVFRNTLPEILQAFDFADPNIQQGKRNASTIAPQALLMMNHPFVIDQAHAAAARRISSNPKQLGETVDETLDGVFQEVLGRSASPEEKRLIGQYIRQQEMRHDISQPARSSVETSDEYLTRWALVYQTLFQCVDFRYLD
ncbi:DUF1553 domain-containing protein [Stieleria varia]|uniref:Xanthan lyase n=1 Tax=Stieleria varia TaxID=2528005 RepID=A0A5C5ZXN4_9BACT|nr:DUF1553 domain-containing protein [Stieleria varia]TWT92414.1 Xanthan lyase precursor [Stieleria varia]